MFFVLDIVRFIYYIQYIVILEQEGVFHDDGLDDSNLDNDFVLPKDKDVLFENNVDYLKSLELENDLPHTIDVFMGYTEEALMDFEGDVDELVRAYVVDFAYANEMFMVSEIDTRYRLVGIENIGNEDTSQSPSGQLVLFNLQDSADGYFDGIDELIDESGADLFQAVTSEVPGQLGIGYIGNISMLQNREYFSTVSSAALTRTGEGSYEDYGIVVAHEFGHNNGLYHFSGGDESGFNDYGRGVKYVGPDEYTSTVMAGTVNRVVGRYSTPEIGDNGVVWGDSDHDCKRSLIDTDYFMEHLNNQEIPNVVEGINAQNGFIEGTTLVGDVLIPFSLITVQYNEEEYQIISDSDGKWQLNLPHAPENGSIDFDLIVNNGWEKDYSNMSITEVEYPNIYLPMIQ